MTLPDLLQTLALAAVSTAVIIIGTGSDGAETAGIIALLIIALAFIIRTDQPRRWHK